MKRVRIYLTIAVALLFVIAGNAQLTGTRNIPGDYATLAAAITDLNAQGVGAGGVTLNLVAGNNQAAPAGGYSITATGTVANPIIFVGNSNTITASASLTVGSFTDGIFKIIGGDYITIRGFSILENPSNTTTTAASNNMTEWGIALLYASATDGAQHVTLRDNTISLGAVTSTTGYQNSFGIYSNNRHTATNITVLADITAASGANNNLHIYGNTISNVNVGICVVGSATGDFMATGLDIGGSGGADANSITNYGKTGTMSFLAAVGVDNTVNGIYVNTIINLNISYNTITSSNGFNSGGTGTIRGINVLGGTLPTTGSISATITHNNISVKSGIASGQIQGILLNYGNAITTYDLSFNDFNNCGYVGTSGTVVVTLINTTLSGINMSVNNNSFTNLTINTSSLVSLITMSFTTGILSNAVLNINNNSIVGTFSKSVSGNTFYGLRSENNSTPATNVTETNTGNNFSNITLAGSTALNLWNNQDAGTSLSKTISNNIFENITGGSGVLTVMTINGGNTGSISGNRISNVTATNSITGISASGGALDISSNTIHSLSASGGAFATTGILVVNSDTRNIYKNKIYNLQSDNAAATVNGITISGGTTTRIYNNLIGDLKTPSANSATDAIRGINLSSTTPNSSIGVYNNTIYLAATLSGANFSSTGVFHSASAIATTAALTLSNNIIVNASIPNGTGNSVALRRSGTALTNFNSASNNNLFYAGTPGLFRFIYHDGANSDQTLAAYKTRVAPRDINSVTESPTFLSTTGSSANFLHIDGSVATQIEKGGKPIVFVSDDYDGVARNASFPDIGADEFAGIATDNTGPNIEYTPLSHTTSTSNRSIVANITDEAGVASGGSAPLIYYRKGASTYFSAVATSIAGNNYTFTIDYANVTGGSVAAGDVIQYYISAQDALGNLTTVPFGGSGITPPGSTAPGSPNQYNIINTYTWQGGTTDFQTAGNWSPARTTPNVSDILVFDGSVTASPTVTNIPSQTIAKLIFQTNVNATLNAAVAGNTITLDYEAGQSVLSIPSGSTVNLGTTTALNLAYSSTEGLLGSIAGTLNLNQASTFTFSNGSETNATTTVSGTLAMNGTSSVNGASLITLVFNSGSVLNFGKISGTVPTANYDLGSTVRVTGIISGTSLTWPVTIGSLTWDCASQGSGIVFAMSQVNTITGSFTIQNSGAGSFNLGAMDVLGNIVVNGGTLNIPAGTVFLTGDLIQNGGTISKTGTSAAGITWNVANVNQTAGSLNMGTVNGPFRLTAISGNMNFASTVNGGTGGAGLTGGLQLTFTATGNQTLTTNPGTTSARVGITVNKTSGNCTLLSDFTINPGAGALTLTNGKLTVAASKTLTITPTSTFTGASSSNYIVSEASGANLGKLKYSGLTTSAQSFAIGTATNYMSVTITPTITGSSFAVGVFEGATANGAPNGTSLGAGVLNSIVKATYQIDNSVVTTPASVSLAWNAGQEGSNFTGLGNSLIGIAKYNGATYDPITGTGDNTANTATASISSFSPFVVASSVPKVALKVFLQGAYNNATGMHKDVTSTWATVLNANALSQPYSAAPFSYAGTESVSNGFFTSTGATTDITDWVLVELRDQTTPATVIARRAAFVREDGVVVDLDGTSNVVFPGVANGNYFMTIKHRNHLSIRTSATIAIDGSISSTGTLYNLTTAQSQAFQDGGIGTNAAMGVDGSTFIMWGGNGNSDIAVRASGPPADNDYLFLVNDVLGGNTATILSNVYHAADFNLDGVVRASGPPAENDYLILVNAILGGNTAIIYTAHQ